MTGRNSFFTIILMMMVLIGCGNSMGILFEKEKNPFAIPSSSSLVVESPIFNYASGMYSHDMEIEITSPTDGAEIFYSTGQRSVNENSKKYSSRINLNGDGNSITIRAMSVLNGVQSDESIVTYSIDYGKVSTPQFKVVGKPFNHELGGFYQHDIQVRITSSTPGAEIYYTIDGSTPDTNSSAFSYPVYINGLTGTMTISAYAVKDGYDNSDIETATFTVEYLTTEPPLYDPPAGEYIAGQVVNLYSETDGATIIYTTDGTDPMSSSTIKYGNSVIIEDNMIIRAYAMKAGMWSSIVTSAEYNVVE